MFMMGSAWRRVAGGSFLAMERGWGDGVRRKGGGVCGGGRHGRRVHVLV